MFSVAGYASPCTNVRSMAIVTAGVSLGGGIRGAAGTVINKYIIPSTATCIHNDTLHEQEGNKEIETERRDKRGEKDKRNRRAI